MAIAGFQQDPQGMPGMGWVADEFGNRRYLYAPELAQQFGQQTPDMRLALGGMSAPQAPQAPGQARPAAPSSISDVQASFMPEPEKNAATAANAATSSGQPQNLPEAITNKTMNDIGQAMLREDQKRPTNVPGGYLPKGREESVGQQGRPIGEGELEDIWGRAGERAGTRIQQGELEAQQQFGKAQNAYAALPQQYAAMETARKKRDEIDQRVNTTMSEVNQNMEEAKNAEKGFNPNRLFSGASGAVAGIGAAIFRAMGAYAQIKGRMPNNPAGEVIDSWIQRDIDQQKEQIRASNGRVDNALKRLMIYRGDLPQAESELRAYQQSFVQGRMEAYAAATGLPQVQLNMQKDLTDIQDKAAAEASKVRDRAYGVHAAKVEEMYRPAHTEGAGPTLDQALTRAGKFANVLETLGKAGENKQKGNELVVPDGRGGQIQARTKEESVDLRTAHSSMIEAGKIADKMGEIAGSTSIAEAGRGLVPWTTAKERDWNVQREALMHAFSNSLTGKSTVVREQAMQRFSHDLAGKPWSPGAQKALQEIKGVMQDNYQSAINSQLAPEEVRRRAEGGQQPIVEDK